MEESRSDNNHIVSLAEPGWSGWAERGAHGSSDTGTVHLTQQGGGWDASQGWVGGWRGGWQWIFLGWGGVGFRAGEVKEQRETDVQRGWGRGLELKLALEGKGKGDNPRFLRHSLSEKSPRGVKHLPFVEFSSPGNKLKKATLLILVEGNNTTTLADF